MEIANSISGGRTSGYMAIHYPADINIFACVCIDYPKAMPKDPAVLRYCQDKLNGNFIASAEVDETLIALMQLEQILGKNIVWVRGKSFDQIIDEAGRLPTWARRFCTTEMKILPIFEHIYFRYGFVIEQIGIRYDELWRAFKVEKGKPPEKKIKAIMTLYPVSCKNFGEHYMNRQNIHWANKTYPLMDNCIRRKDVITFWEKTFPCVYWPADSNCAGCHHKSPSQIKKNYEKYPVHLEWFAMQEEKGKRNTWHDDMIPYKHKFTMPIMDLFEADHQNTGSCDTGYCGLD